MQPVDAENQRFLTVKEFAKRAGISAKTVRRKIDRGQIRYKRPAWQILIPISELEELNKIIVREA